MDRMAAMRARTMVSLAAMDVPREDPVMAPSWRSLCGVPAPSSSTTSISEHSDGRAIATTCSGPHFSREMLRSYASSLTSSITMSTDTGLTHIRRGSVQFSARRLRTLRLFASLNVLPSPLLCLTHSLIMQPPTTVCLDLAHKKLKRIYELPLYSLCRVLHIDKPSDHALLARAGVEAILGAEQHAVDEQALQQATGDAFVTALHEQFMASINAAEHREMWTRIRCFLLALLHLGLHGLSTDSLVQQFQGKEVGHWYRCIILFCDLLDDKVAADTYVAQHLPLLISGRFKLSAVIRSKVWSIKVLMD